MLMVAQGAHLDSELLPHRQQQALQARPGRLFKSTLDAAQGLLVRPRAKSQSLLREAVAKPGGSDQLPGIHVHIVSDVPQNLLWPDQPGEVRKELGAVFSSGPGRTRTYV